MKKSISLVLATALLAVPFMIVGCGSSDGTTPAPAAVDNGPSNTPKEAVTGQTSKSEADQRSANAAKAAGG